MAVAFVYFVYWVEFFVGDLGWWLVWFFCLALIELIEPILQAEQKAKIAAAGRWHESQVGTNAKFANSLMQLSCNAIVC